MIFHGRMDPKRAQLRKNVFHNHIQRATKIVTRNPKYRQIKVTGFMYKLCYSKNVLCIHICPVFLVMFEQNWWHCANVISRVYSQCNLTNKYFSFFLCIYLLLFATYCNKRFSYFVPPLNYCLLFFLLSKYFVADMHGLSTHTSVEFIFLQHSWQNPPLLHLTGKIFQVQQKWHIHPFDIPKFPSTNLG